MKNRDKHAGTKPRKRTLLPEFKKLMAEKPGDEVPAALDEIRGDVPAVILANSAPASFPPEDEAPRPTNTPEPPEFPEAELAKNNAASPLPPPTGYTSWLDYAVGTMDTRSLFNDLAWGREPQWSDDTSREQMEDAARAELALLRSDNERNHPK